MAKAEINLQSAEAARKKITEQQDKRIKKMFNDLARQARDEAKLLESKTNVSSVLRRQYLDGLAKQLNQQATLDFRNLRNAIVDDMTAVSSEVCNASKTFLEKYGMKIDGAFSHVPTEVVRSLSSGEVYDGNWTLSSRIWGCNKKVHDDINAVIAKGTALNKSAYEIAKDIEQYVDPSAKKDWQWSKVYPNTSRRVDFNAQRLSRTIVSHAYQQSFMATCGPNPFVTEYVWHSAHSARVCPICKERDGKHFPKNDLPMDHPMGMCWMEAAIPDNMTDIANRLADWSNGASDPALDRYATYLVSSKPGTTAGTRTPTENKAIKDAKTSIGATAAKQKRGFMGVENHTDWYAWYNSLTNVQKNKVRAYRSQTGKSREEIFMQLKSGQPIKLAKETVAKPPKQVYNESERRSSLFDKISSGHSENIANALFDEIDKLPDEKRKWMLMHESSLGEIKKSSQSYFQQGTNSIHMDLRQVGNTSTSYGYETNARKRQLNTFYHEYGHMIDYALSGAEDFSANKDFYSAIQKDYAKFLHVDDSPKAWVWKYLRENEYDGAGASDIISGMTNGRCNITFGHAREYWERRGDDAWKEITSEAFANMNAAYCNDEARAVMVKLFPKSYKWFEGAVKNVLEK